MKPAFEPNFLIPLDNIAENVLTTHPKRQTSLLSVYPNVRQANVQDRRAWSGAIAISI